MKDGIVQQIGDPRTMYNQPTNIFVAGFIGSPSMNFLDARLVAENGSLWLDMQSFRLKMPKREENLDKHIDKKVVVGFRPEDILDKPRAAFAGDGMS